MLSHTRKDVIIKEKQKESFFLMETIVPYSKYCLVCSNMIIFDSLQSDITIKLKLISIDVLTLEVYLVKKLIEKKRE